MSATAASPSLSTAEAESAAVSWLVLMLMGVCTFLNVYPAQTLLPTFEQVFDAPKALVGLSVSATTCAVALASPIAGLVVDRFDRRRMLAGLFAAIAVATFGAASAHSLAALVAWRFVQGLFIPAMYVGAMAVIAETWPARRLGSGMATYITGTVLGGFLGRALAGVAAGYAGWQAAFWMLGTLEVAGAIAAWACLPRARAPRPQAALDARVLGVVARDRALVPIYAVGFVMLFTLVALFTYVNFHLAAPPFGLGPAALGAVFMVYLFGMVVTPLAGRAIDRFGFRTVGALALVATATGVALTLVPVLWVVIAGLAIAANGVFVGQAAATGLLGRVAGTRRVPAAGIYLACYYAGGSAGGVLPAWAWIWGGWPACAALVGGTALATALLMFRLWPARPEAA